MAERDVIIRIRTDGGRATVSEFKELGAAAVQAAGGIRLLDQHGRPLASTMQRAGAAAGQAARGFDRAGDEASRAGGRIRSSLVGLNRQIADSRARFDRDFGELARIAQTGAVVVAAGVAATAFAVHKANQAFDRFSASQRTLAATAKITGTNLQFLEDTSAAAQDEFQLSAVLANDLTIQLSRLAGRAGDVSQAGPGLEAFLNLGAAKGLGAAQTLDAVRQAILGIDEGTDKLFGVNPITLYERFADRIGKSAASLSDAEKAQAILNAALEEGGKVAGEYGRFLDSAPGKQALLNQRLEQLGVAFGRAIAPVREQVLDDMATQVEDLAAAIARNQDEIREFAANLASAARGAVQLTGALAKPFIFTFNVVANPAGAFEDFQAFLDQQRINRAFERDPDGMRGLDFRGPRERAREFLEGELAAGGPRSILTGERVSPGMRVSPTGETVSRDPEAAAAAAAARAATDAAAAEERRNAALKELQQRASTLLTILDAQTEAQDDSTAATAALRDLHAQIQRAIAAENNMLSERGALLLGLRNEVGGAIAPEVAVRRGSIPGLSLERGVGALFGGERRGIGLVAPAFGGLQGDVFAAPPSLADRARGQVFAGLSPSFAARAIGFVGESDEAVSKLAEGQEEFGQTADVVVGAMGRMADAAIKGSDQMASSIIGGLSQIISSVQGLGVAGSIVGVVGGLVAGLFGRERDRPQPVRVTDFDPPAERKLQERPTGPDTVIIQFVDPRTGRRTEEIEYDLRRRTRLDAVERLPGGR